MKTIQNRDFANPQRFFPGVAGQEVGELAKVAFKFSQIVTNQRGPFIFRILHQLEIRQSDTCQKPLRSLRPLTAVIRGGAEKISTCEDRFSKRYAPRKSVPFACKQYLFPNAR
jgi:hypothetical protein